MTPVPPWQRATAVSTGTLYLAAKRFAGRGSKIAASSPDEIRASTATTPRLGRQHRGVDRAVVCPAAVIGQHLGGDGSATNDRPVRGPKNCARKVWAPVRPGPSALGRRHTLDEVQDKILALADRGHARRAPRRPRPTAVAKVCNLWARRW